MINNEQKIVYTDRFREDRTLKGPIAMGGTVLVRGLNSMWKVTKLDRERGVAEAENLEHAGVRMAAPLKLLKKV